jgi:hypothetical protein
MTTSDGAATVIGGFPTPDGRPIFLSILLLHVAAATVCVLASGLAAVSRNNPDAIPAPTGSTTGRSPSRSPRPGADGATLTARHLLAIGTVAIASATLGLLARRRRQPDWIRRHSTAMAISYIALLTGFYVDNGPACRCGTCYRTSPSAASRWRAAAGNRAGSQLRLPTIRRPPPPTTPSAVRTHDQAVDSAATRRCPLRRRTTATHRIG